MRVFTVHLPDPRAARGTAPTTRTQNRPHDFRLREWRNAAAATGASGGNSTPMPDMATTPARPATLQDRSEATHAETAFPSAERSADTDAAEAATPAEAAASPRATTASRGSVPVLNAAPSQAAFATTAPVDTTVDVPASLPGDSDHLSAEALRDLRLVPEGFSGWAFVLGPFWFLFRGLWLATLIWVAVAVLLAGLRFAAPALAPYTPWMTLALLLLTGFHARDADRWTLHRRGLRERGIVLGLDEEDALLRLGLGAGSFGAGIRGVGEQGA